MGSGKLKYIQQRKKEGKKEEKKISDVHII
jgi:hypothetical protein